MRKNGKTIPIWKQAIVILIMIAFTSVSTAPFAATDSVCAEVKLVINQKLSFERQAFDARMAIGNGLTDDALHNVSIELLFFDNYGQPAIATQDPNATDALFFYRIDSMSGIDDLNGNGSVEENTEAEIHWLIIPTASAAGSELLGKIYYVGAKISYTHNGESQTVEVTPDFIRVKPLPELTLDYFLPHDVYGDDPFTAEIEPVIPFTLGVRVKNSGFAASTNTQLESAQIKIVENKQDLLIGFKILASYVANLPVNSGLALNFGDILPQTAQVGRWLMTASLSGKFTEFNATFTHADSLGGALTSLLKAVNTHRLVHDVKVDLPGRDDVLDFLALDDSVLRVYESEGVDTVVQDRSASAVLSASDDSAKLIFDAEPGFAYVKVDDPHQGKFAVENAVRSDGKILPAENLWLSQTRNEDMSWSYFVNLFDADSTGSYVFDYVNNSKLIEGIEGYVYYDFNRNGMKDADEPGIDNFPLTFQHYILQPGETWPQFYKSYSEVLQQGHFFFKPGDEEWLADLSLYSLRPNHFTVEYEAFGAGERTLKRVVGKVFNEYTQTVQPNLLVNLLLVGPGQSDRITLVTRTDDEGNFEFLYRLNDDYQVAYVDLEYFDFEFTSGDGSQYQRFNLANKQSSNFFRFKENYAIEIVPLDELFDGQEAH